MLPIGELKRGTTLILDNDPYVVTVYDFVKPGKGQAMYRTKLRNMISGSIVERTFRSGDSFEPASLDQRNVQYLYREGDNYVFMDNKTYDQFTLPEDALGDAKNYLIDNLEVEILFFRDKPIGVNVPNFINLRVVKCEPWSKGDTSGSDSKPATMETGVVLRVPPFINEGDMIQIDTRTGEYLSRVKE
jgi:elongation factor P